MHGHLPSSSGCIHSLESWKSGPDIHVSLCDQSSVFKRIMFLGLCSRGGVRSSDGNMLVYSMGIPGYLNAFCFIFDHSSRHRRFVLYLSRLPSHNYLSDLLIHERNKRSNRRIKEESL